MRGRQIGVKMIDVHVAVAAVMGAWWFVRVADETEADSVGVKNFWVKRAVAFFLHFCRF